MFGDRWKRGPVSLEIAANLIYGPSCISFEYALSRYGMIPERATVVTSLAIGKAKEFHTPIGIFRYQSISPEKFGVGIDYIELPNSGGFFIASREKALADFLSRIKTSLSLSDLRFFLFQEMRMDEELFKTLNRSKIQEISYIYKSKNIENLSLL